MNRLPLLVAALVAIVASLIPASMPTAAGTTLQRCRAPDGSIGYTDKSCAVFGAESVPVSADLMTRIATDAVDGYGYESGMGSLAIDHAPGRRSLAGGCARSTTQLAMDLHGALALGDVNRVAESYHFAGMSSSAGEATMDRLQRLLDRTVLDTRYFDAGITSSAYGHSAALLAGPPVAAGGGILQVVLAGADGSATAIDFDVHRYAGCYFVSF